MRDARMSWHRTSLASLKNMWHTFALSLPIWRAIQPNTPPSCSQPCPATSELDRELDRKLRTRSTPPELDRKLDRPLPNSIANSIAPSHLTANSTALPYSTADAITDNADGWLRAKRGQHE